MIKKILYLLLGILLIVNIYFINKLGIIPDIYIYCFIGIMIFIFFISWYFANKGKKLFVGVGIMLFIIMLLFNLGCSVIMVRANKFLYNITKEVHEVDNYSILVLKEAGYKNIDDIRNIEYGVIVDNNYEELKSILNDKIGSKVSKYDNIKDLINDFLLRKIEVIVVNESYISIIDDNMDILDKVIVLENVSVKKKEEVASKEVNVSKEKNSVSDNSFNVYISGIDTYGSIDTVSRSDVNMIATVNIDNGHVLLTNIPRDMYVPLNGDNGKMDKLTHAGVYGVNTSIRTLESFLDTEIDYYVRINFNTLVSIVDYLGGIDVYSDYSFKAGKREYVVGMNYNLSGKEALAFARNRYAFSDGDRQRGRNQQKIIEAIIKKITESRDIETYFNLINTLENSFQTNLNKDTIVKFINLQIENNYNWEIEMIDVNGYDSSNYTYSYPFEKLYVMEVDSNSLDSTKNKIKENLEE